MSEKSMKELRDEVALHFFKQYGEHLALYVPPSDLPAGHIGLSTEFNQRDFDKVAQDCFKIAEAFLAARYDADNKQSRGDG